MRMLAVVLISSHIVECAVESSGTRTIVIERHDVGTRSSVDDLTHQHFIRSQQSMTLNKLLTIPDNSGTHCMSLHEMNSIRLRVQVSWPKF